ncbi:hypothetical protein CEXT_632921, partial [Caerostris extrusa]
NRDVFPLLFCNQVDLQKVDCMDVWLDSQVNFDPKPFCQVPRVAVFMAARAILSLIFVNLAASSVNVADVKGGRSTRSCGKTCCFSGATVKIEKAIQHAGL